MLDVWFREDAERLLTMAAQAAERYPAGRFRDGYLAAVADVARGFGVHLDGARAITVITFDNSENERYRTGHHETMIPSKLRD